MGWNSWNGCHQSSGNRCEHRLQPLVKTRWDAPMLTDSDDSGRLLQIAICGDFALMYWIDDADRHGKILDIHAADR
jgi:hypothetical protein